MNLIDLGFSSTFIWDLIKKSTTKTNWSKIPLSTLFLAEIHIFLVNTCLTKGLVIFMKLNKFDWLP